MYEGAETSYEEVNAVLMENQVRESRGHEQRTKYSGETIPKDELKQCP
jgi:hypothetical protein